MPVKKLLEVIYPPVCESCGEAYFDGDIPYLCNTCSRDILKPIEMPYCEVCGQGYYGGMPEGMRCGNCGDRYLSFDFAIGAYYAEGILLDWMHRFKYAKEIHFSRMFGKLMSRVWEDQRLSKEDNWIVVPVPLHRKRLRERGFNQSFELAKQWVQYSPPGIRLKLTPLLKRSRHTIRQATLDRNQRLTNLKDAFEISRKLPKDQNILIIDDVLTTGTTANECAEVISETLSPNKIAILSALRG